LPGAHGLAVAHQPHHGLAQRRVQLDHRARRQRGQLGQADPRGVHLKGHRQLQVGHRAQVRQGGMPGLGGTGVHHLQGGRHACSRMFGVDLDGGAHDDSNSEVD